MGTPITSKVANEICQAFNDMPVERQVGIRRAMMQVLKDNQVGFSEGLAVLCMMISEGICNVSEKKNEPLDDTITEEWAEDMRQVLMVTFAAARRSQRASAPNPRDRKG